MKRFMFFAIGFVLTLSTVAIATKGSDPVTTAAGKATEKAAVKAEPTAKTVNIKETKMTATGKVVEISDTIMKIERSAKGEMEAMEFILEKANPGIKVGNEVKVTYVTKDGKNVAVKVASKIAKKAIK